MVTIILGVISAATTIISCEILPQNSSITTPEHPARDARGLHAYVGWYGLKVNDYAVAVQLIDKSICQLSQFKRDVISFTMLRYIPGVCLDVVGAKELAKIVG